MRSYIDPAGLTNRANSALLRIARLVADTSLPPEVRLVKIAELMTGEPVLTCPSPAAGIARREAARR